MNETGDNTADQTDGLDEPREPMSYGERNVWASAIAVAVSAAFYLAVMFPRALEGPIDQISWVTPMLWAIGISIVGTIVLSILGASGSEIGGAIGASVRSALTGRTVEREAPVHAEDVRDKEISAYGERVTMTGMGFAMLVALILAMLHVNTFWIGSAMFVVGSVSSLVGSGVKIHAYRRGF